MAKRNAQTEAESAVQSAALQQLRSLWQAGWDQALQLWSPYVRLHPPVFCLSRAEEKQAGLQGSFAMIRLTDLNVILSLLQINHLGLGGFALEVMAHEIGHHVFCPADLTDQARLLARIRRGLPTCENFAPLVGNLYSDLLINDRLQRVNELRMDKLYAAIRQPGEDQLWNFYLRIYEILWSLPRGTLVTAKLSEEAEGDAQLGNRLIRHYARDWLSGAGRFAALCLAYLLKERFNESRAIINPWLDTQQTGDNGSLPAGLTEIEADEISGAVHPALEDTGEEAGAAPAAVQPAGKGSGGNYREPFEYGEILKNLGINLAPREVAIRYYRERAVPYLIPFPAVTLPQSTEPLPEGLETWEIGSSLDKINWLESVIRSPVIIPGYTTLQQFYGTSRGAEPAVEPVDLDLYVDCSGSMPDPTRNVSYLTLAAAIIAISALRAGSRVQATLWSGAHEFSSTPGFVRNEQQILEIMTGYYGGGTAFPIHILRDTYNQRKTRARKVHILVISDEGVTTMFDKDEQGNSGRKVAARALAAAGGGGTFVLNLYGAWQQNGQLVQAAKMGWEIYAIRSWEELTGFSRAFARKHYIKEDNK